MLIKGQSLVRKDTRMATAPVSSCMYSQWLEEYRVTQETTSNCTTKKNKREYKHVPHKEKPVQVVEKRNARERRRVQAVNSAFARLRKMVPVEHARGKRISKVKTLQYAIDYIHALMDLLEQNRNYIISHYYKLQEDCHNYDSYNSIF